MPTMNKPVESQDRGTQTPSSASSSTAGAVVQKVKDQAKDVMDTASEMAGQAKDKVQDLAGQAKEKVQELAAATAEKAEDFGKEVTNLIRRYPIPALLVGFGIGLFLGRVSRI